MNRKRIIPVLMLIIMAGAAISLKRCNANRSKGSSSAQSYSVPSKEINAPPANDNSKSSGFDRDPERLFYTKHARCRMDCRHISQQEVKDILVHGNINYNKSELHEERGPKYAIEGNTNDGQHVRIIFAPNTQHISVVTVIDLEEEFSCNCN